jgi:hypothetical protein
MSKNQASSKGIFTVGKLAGTVVAAGAVLFAAPAAVAFADPLGDLGHLQNQTVNQVNSVVVGNVNGGNKILQGNVNGGNNILQGNVNGANKILQGNVNNTNLILRGLLGLH